MKVIHFVSSLNVGGAERFVIDLCLEQMKIGVSPVILSFGDESDPLVESCGENSIPTRIIQGNFIRRQIQLFKLLLDSDILHIHSPSALRSALLAIKFLKSKVIVYTRHGAAPLKKRRWRQVHKAIRGQIAMITFVSNEGLEIFMSSYGWNEIPSKVISNGVNTDEFRNIAPPLSANCSKVRLGVVGRLIPLKGQINLLKAISQLPESYQSRLEVHFYGEGECKEQLVNFSETELKATKIVFHGNVLDRTSIFNSFDLLVMPSETEGLSLAIMEAMAAGRPVLATLVGDTYLLVTDQTGWGFEHGDQDRFVCLLSQILDSPGTINERGKASRLHIINGFSMHSAAMEYQSAYEFAIKRREIQLAPD